MIRYKYIIHIRPTQKYELTKWQYNHWGLRISQMHDVDISLFHMQETRRALKNLVGSDLEDIVNKSYKLLLLTFRSLQVLLALDRPDNSTPTREWPPPTLTCRKFRVACCVLRETEPRRQRHRLPYHYYNTYITRSAINLRIIYLYLIVVVVSPILVIN